MNDFQNGSIYLKITRAHLKITRAYLGKSRLVGGSICRGPRLILSVALDKASENFRLLEKAPSFL